MAEIIPDAFIVVVIFSRHLALDFCLKEYSSVKN